MVDLLLVGVKRGYYPGATWNDNETHLNGYHWQDLPVYNPEVDPQSYGSSWGLPRRSTTGGNWALGSHCGSSSVDCGYFSSTASLSNAVRGCKENRSILGQLGMKLISI
jgi:hypothetical protein